MRTYMARKGEITRKWWPVGAQGKTLGRMPNRIARILLGKHKPIYTLKG